MTIHLRGDTENNPIQFTDALVAPSVIPGDTLLLADGTYTGDFITRLAGSVAGDVIIRAAHPGKAKINGSIFLETNKYLTFQDIEFTFEDWITRQGANDYPDGRVLEGTGASIYSPMTIYGARISLINCVLHDGFDFYSNSAGMHLYGCLIFNNGVRQLSGGGNGHGLYGHATNPANAPTVIDACVMMSNFNYGWHINSDNPANKCEYYTMQNTITGKCNGKNIFGSGAGASKGLIWKNNCTWDTYICFNYSSNTNSEDLTVEDSYFVGGNAARLGAAWFKMFKQMTVRRNVFVAHSTPELFNLKYPPTGDVAYDFDKNDYYTTGTGAAFMPYNRSPFTGDYLTFADWQAATGLDANSTEHRDVTPPDFVKLYPNTYDSGKCNLAVYNWSEAETVVVDVSAVYQPDEIVRVRNAQDYYNDYEDVAVGQDGKITIPMTGHSVAIPYMDTTALDGSSFPTFGAFMLEVL